jgi:prolyl-tRNA editing enzyme YbaK/EbsC (Cys-tRNA(Pro) deacylase)
MTHTESLEKLDNLLTTKDADYSIFKEDSTIESATDGAARYGITLAETTPTLILKSGEKYFAAIICGNTRISFKKLKQALSVKDITMADPQTVLNFTGAKVGEVSLINLDLVTLIDSNVLKNKDCYGGCGVPKSTLRIDTHDLINLTNAKILDFTDPRPQ